MPAGNRGPRSYRALLALAAVGCAALLGAGSPAAHASGATTTLSNDVVHNLSYATLTGSVPATQTVTVGVFLSNPNQAAEDAYVKQLYDPSSPNYGNYLDPDTFNSQFGVPAATTPGGPVVAAGSRSHGDADRRRDRTTCSPAAAPHRSRRRSARRSTTTPRTAGASTRTRWRRRSPPSLGISNVFGLNNFNKLSIPRVQATGPWTTTTQDATSGNVPKTGLLSIRDLWSIYDAPSTNMGNGQSMAIFGWGVTDPVIPDLRSFEAEWGLPGVPISVKKYGDTSTPDTSGDGATVEWELDTQASTGMAPNVTSETLYFGAPQHRHRRARFDGRLGERQARAAAGQRLVRRVRERRQRERDLHRRHGGARGQGPRAGRGGGSHALLVYRRHRLVLSDHRHPRARLAERRRDPALSRARTGRRSARGRSPWAAPCCTATGTRRRSASTRPPGRTPAAATRRASRPAATRPASRRRTARSTRTATRTSGARGPLCRSTPDVATISGDVGTGNGLAINDDNGADQQGAGTSLSSPLWLGVWARIQAAAQELEGPRLRELRDLQARAVVRRPGLLRRHGRRQPAVSGDAGLRQHDRLGDARDLADHAGPHRPPHAGAQHDAGSDRDEPVDDVRKPLHRPGRGRQLLVRGRGRARARRRSSTSSAAAPSCRPTGRR